MSSNFISLEEAKNLISHYRSNLEKMLTPEFQKSLCFSETFDVEAIQKLISQKECVKFRAYYGMDEENRVCSIFVAVNEKDEDILNGDESIIVEQGVKCPPICSTTSEINR